MTATYRTTKNTSIIESLRIARELAKKQFPDLSIFFYYNPLALSQYIRGVKVTPIIKEDQFLTHSSLVYIDFVNRTTVTEMVVAQLLKLGICWRHYFSASEDKWVYQAMDMFQNITSKPTRLAIVSDSVTFSHKVVLISDDYCNSVLLEIRFDATMVIFIHGVKFFKKPTSSIVVDRKIEPQSLFPNMASLTDAANAISNVASEDNVNLLRETLNKVSETLNSKDSTVEGFMNQLSGAMQNISADVTKKVCIILSIIGLFIAIRDKRKTLVAISAAALAYAYKDDLKKLTLNMEWLTKLKNLFLTSREEDHEMATVPQGLVTDLAPEVATAISMILIGKDISKYDSKSVVEMCKGFSILKTTTQNIVQLVLKICETIVAKCGFASSLDKLFFLINDANDKYIKFCDKVFEIDTKVERKELSNTLSNYEMLSALTKEGQVLYRDIPRHSSTQGLMITMNNCINRLQKYTQAIANTGLLAQGLRQEPVCVLLRGGPGTLKTQTMQHLAHALISAVIHDDERESFESNPEAYYYNRTIEQSFWDGYDSNKVVTIIDDVFQQRDQVGVGESEAMNIIRAVNENSYDLHMANLNDKGSTKFRSKFLLLTTNSETMSCQSILDRGALLRRFHFTYTVVPLPQFEHQDSKQNLMAKKVDISKLPKGELGTSSTRPDEILQFVEHDLLTNKKTGRVFDFKGMVNEILNKYQMHKLFYDQKVMELRARRQEYSGIERQSDMPGTFGKIKNYINSIPLDAEISFPLGQEYDIFFETMCRGVKSDHKLIVLQYYHQFTENEKKQFVRRLMALEQRFNPNEEHGVNYVFDKVISEEYDFVGHVLDLSYPLDQLIFDLSNDESFTSLFPVQAKYVFYTKETRTLKTIIREIFSKIKLALTSWDEFKTYVSWKNSFKLSFVFFGLYSLYSIFFTSQDGTSGETLFDLEPESDYKLRPKKVRANKKSAKDMRATRTVPQLSLVSDAQGEDINLKIVKFNMYSVHLRLENTNEWTKCGYATFIRGNVAILPHHFFDVINSQLEIDPESKVQLKLTGQINETGTSHEVVYDAAQILENVYDTDQLVSQDLICAAFPNFPPRRDIMKYIVTAKDLQTLGRTASCILSTLGQQINTVHTRGEVQSEIYVDGKELEPYTITTAIAYNVATKKGDCGALLSILDPTKKTRKVGGLHVAGSPGQSLGYSALFCKEDIEDCLVQIPEHNLIVSQMDDVTFNSPTLIGDGRFGMLRKVEKAPIANKSAIIKSNMHNTVAQNYMIPAKLRSEFVNNVKRDPWESAMLNYNMTTPIITGDVLSLAADTYKDYIFANSNKDVEPRLFTFEEAVSGIEGTEFDSINRRTSPGYPDVIKHTKGVRGKTFYFGNEDEFDLVGPNALALKKRCEDILEKAKENTRCEHIFMDSLKDELRPIEKAQDFKTRLISASPISLLILYRMYFGAFMLWYKINRIENQSAIGVNVYSVEWDYLAKKLARFSPPGSKNVGAGDYSKFDGSEKPVVHNHILDIIQEWYSGTVEDEKIRRILWLELTNSIHVQGDSLYEWYTSLPSGHPLTATVNTMYNGIAFRYCWLRAFDDQPQYKYKFNEMCYLIALGDDNVFSVHPSVAASFTEPVVGKFMAELGLTYTSETKDVVNEKLRDLTEVEFLKRKWRYSSEVRRYVAPQQVKRLIEMTNWTKKGVNADQISRDNVDSILRELSLHGKEVYSFWAQRVIRSSKENIAYYPKNSSYEINLHEVCSMEMFC